MPPNSEHQLENKKYTFDFCEESYRYKTRYEIFMYLQNASNIAKTVQLIGVLCPIWSQVSVGSASFSTNLQQTSQGTTNVRYTASIKPRRNADIIRGNFCFQSLSLFNLWLQSLQNRLCIICSHKLSVSTYELVLY